MLRKDDQVKVVQSAFLFPLLEDICDKKNPYVRLAHVIDWERLVRLVEPCFPKGIKEGRKSLSPRLVISLLMLKAMNKLSDRDVVEKWSTDGAWQYFSGMEYYEMRRPADPSSLCRWRKRLGEEVLAQILGETVDAARRAKALPKKNLEVVVVDTTAQRQNVKRPGEAHLVADAHCALLRHADRLGIPLHRSYRRVMPRFRVDYADRISRRKTSDADALLAQAKRWLGAVVQDIEADPRQADPALERDLELAHRVLTQTPKTKGKLYSFAQPHTAALVKNGTCTFGTKVGLVTTAKDPYVIGVKVFTDNRYDGRTLDDTLLAAYVTTGVIPKVAACDYGYRGATITLPTQIHCFNRKHRVPPELLPLKRRRPSIEPIIGHLKSDHSLGLNRLSGKTGCAINALLAAIGFNLRKLSRALALFLRRFLAHLHHLTTPHPPASPSALTPSYA